MINKRNIFLWSLYDFANSLASITFFLYFSQWLVIDKKVADIWFNLLFVGATLLLIATAPVLGAISDKRGEKLPFLRKATYLMFITLLVTSLLALFSGNNLALIILACLFFMFGFYFLQLSVTFYNSILSDLAPAKFYGFISGIGLAFNWLGQISGLIITLPFAIGVIYLFGSPGRAQTFLPATILFLLIAFPMLKFFKEAKGKSITINIGREYQNAISHFKELVKDKRMGKFLLGYFFFNDAIQTVNTNLPIYLEQVFKVSDKTKSFLIIGVLATSAIGALICGWLADRVGLKKMLIFVLTSWLLILPVLSAVKDFNIFVLIIILIGFIYGATWTTARAYMVYLSPKDQLTHTFSYYTLAERFSTLVGPLVWGLIILFLVNMGELRYRVAAISMTAFILVGLWIIKDIPSKK